MRREQEADAAVRTTNLAPGALWKGRIRFAGIEVGVRLHSAVREERVEFHLVHKPDRVRLQQRMICPLENLPVPREEQDRGYEVEKGAYVILDPDEMERAPADASRLIEVHEFVGAGELDPLYLGRTHYLADDGDPLRYAALAEALRELDAAGICTWTMRGRAYFGALGFSGGKLRLTVLRYADEVIPARSLELAPAPLSEKEIEIGSQLVEHLTAPFEPAKFRDEHQARLKALIERKAGGRKIAVVKPRRLRSTGPDRLLQALEASLRKVA